MLRKNKGRGWMSWIFDCKTLGIVSLFLFKVTFKLNTGL